VSEHAGRPTKSSGGHDAGERVRASFARQGLMRLLGAEVVEVGEGTCVVEGRDERVCAATLQTVSLSPARAPDRKPGA